MRVRCPAKINLDLRVGPARADGFHPLSTWMVTVGLYDMLDLSPADEIELTCDDPTVPADARNLVWRAAELLKPADRGVSIALNKGIPAGGGLGGGSSDAAHALLALDAFWSLNLEPATLASLAAELGSDVPFFLHLPSAVCHGRGEIVTPVPTPAANGGRGGGGAGWAVLILPAIAMPTPAVFRRFDELAVARGTGFQPVFSPSQTRVENPCHDVRDDDRLPESVGASPRRQWPFGATSLLATLVNDLEPAAFDLRPDLAALRDRAERTLGRPVRMSGSGSTLFTLYDGPMPAIAAAAQVEAELGVRSVAVPVGVYARGIPPDDPSGEGDEAPRD